MTRVHSPLDQFDLKYDGGSLLYICEHSFVRDLQLLVDTVCQGKRM
jgi:hypothetical protein